MIFQAREATKSRRSSGSGLMVTAWDRECHINMLTDEMGIYKIFFVTSQNLIMILGVNPEHMLVPRAKGNGNGESRQTANRTVHKYVKNLVTTTEIISPDDDRVKLTETMKKECEGKTIYYNKEHVLQSGEDFRLGVAGVQSKEKLTLEKMLPKIPMNQTRRGRSFCRSSDIQVSESFIK